MDRITFVIELLFDDKQKLFLHVLAFWKQEPINLALSTFLTFLYKNETALFAGDLQFSYMLAKLLKKVRIGNKLFEAVAGDYDQGQFFKKALEADIHLRWKKGQYIFPIRIDETLPLQIAVSKHHDHLTCTLQNRQQWLENPLSWMVFEAEKEAFGFSMGTIIQNPSHDFQQFLGLFLDRASVTYKISEVFHFIRHIYEPYKNLLHWELQADLFHVLPKQSPPIPILTLEYKNDCLLSALSYRYASKEILPDEADDILTEAKTGEMLHRMRDLEAIYQQDLMDLFMEYQLPFMLQNPGDIGQFLSRVVPILKSRDWEIRSHVGQFNLNETPVDLAFTLHQDTGQDWFYFEPTCEIEGEKLSLYEVARLMIQNQGYIKTKSGFVKLSDPTKKQLELLHQFGAFKPNQKFKRAEVLPLVSLSTVQGGGKETQDFLDRVYALTHCQTVDPGPGFTGELRDYQQYGLNWLNFIYQSGFGGILADDMGLGKTVQTLAFSNQLTEPGPILVIGPTNVIYNWEREIKTFTPKRKALVYTGSKRSENAQSLGRFDFIITSFGVLKNDFEILSKITYKALFIDEAQYIKNPQTQVSKAVKALNARFRLAMTGTPIENHLQDLWNLFDFVMPKYLGNQNFFESEVKDGNKEIVKTKIRPFVLRREKKEVLNSLPDKTEIIVSCQMSPEQQTLYETVLKAVKVGLKNLSGKQERLNVLAALLKLRQVCIHPALLTDLEGNNLPSAKFELIQEKILELIDEGHKIVLFTQFTKMLDLVSDWAKKESIYIERIDGSVAAKLRQTAIERFQEADSAGLFLISLRAGGVGINLTAADYVLHVDPWWNPAVEAQATDRVHRMGQKNKVIVYKFITQGTVEEKIQALQEDKRQLMSEMIDVDSAEGKKIDFEALQDILMS